MATLQSCWAKAARKEREKKELLKEVVWLTDSPMETGLEAPSTSFRSPNDVIIRKSNFNTNNTLDVPIDTYRLRELGCRSSESFEFPAHADIVQLDIEIMKQLFAQNCVLVYPRRWVKICAAFLHNFLSIFSNCRACICTSSDEFAQALVEECVAWGAEESAFAHLSSSRIPESARVLVASSTLLHRVVQSESRASEIRAIIFHTGEAENATRIKPIMNELKIKNMTLRCIVLDTGSSQGARTAASTKRQQLITCARVSRWIEPPPPPHSPIYIRPCASAVTAENWSEDEEPGMLPLLDELYKVYGSALQELLSLRLPSSSHVRELIFAPLHLLQMQCGDKREDGGRFEGEKKLCQWMLSLCRAFHLYGIVAFKHALSAKDEASEEVRSRLRALSCWREVEAVNERIVEQVGAFTHPKVARLKSLLRQTYSCNKVARVLLLVEAAWLAEAMGEELRTFAGLMSIPLFVLGGAVPLSRASSLLSSGGGCLVLPVDAAAAAECVEALVADGLRLIVATSQRSSVCVRSAAPHAPPYVVMLLKGSETLRKVAAAELVRTKHERSDAQAFLNRFNFKFTRSDMPIDVSNFGITLSESAEVKRKEWVRCDFSLSVLEEQVLRDECVPLPPSIHRPLSFSSTDLIYNEDVHGQEGGHPSSTSRRLVSLVRPPAVPLSQQPPAASPLHSCRTSQAATFYLRALSILNSMRELG